MGYAERRVGFVAFADLHSYEHVAGAPVTAVICEVEESWTQFSIVASQPLTWCCARSEVSNWLTEECLDVPLNLGWSKGTRYRCERRR